MLPPPIEDFDFTFRIISEVSPPFARQTIRLYFTSPRLQILPHLGCSTTNDFSCYGLRFLFSNILDDTGDPSYTKVCCFPAATANKV